MVRLNYYTNCVSWPHDVDILLEIIDAAEEIELEEFKKNVNLEDYNEIVCALGYDASFPIENDWHVSYHKSEYKGELIFYIRHSAIEYLFMEAIEEE